jgi:arylamine N-acetyltransferase
VHIVLIITFEEGDKYICDVAFGGDGPTTPQKLVEDNPILNLGTQENRYIYDTLPQNPPRRFSKPQKYWIYQYRNKPEVPWNSFYCFTEDEYLIGDYNVMNYFTSAGKTFQRTLILINKFLRAEAEDGEEYRVSGKVMLVGNIVKRNPGGRTEIVQECHSEAERIEALKKWFGITLTEEEKAGIKGLVTEIREAELSV